MFVVFESDRDVHIVPVQDKEPHCIDEFCFCEPLIDGGFRNIYRHRSWDNREAQEHLINHRTNQKKDY